MADVTYGVNVEYLSTGNLSLPSSSLDKATSGFDKLQSSAHSFNGVLDSIIGGMWHLGVAAAEGIGAAVVGGFGLALHESIKFNEQMENSQVGIATMANAAEGLNGFLDPKEAFGNQYRLAGDVIKQMRQDAMKLPGTFADLQRIMTDISGPGENIGMGQANIEKMSAEAMSAAAAMNLPFKQVGMQIGEMLSGSARITNRTFRGLNTGYSAKDFNKLSATDRRHVTEDALGKMQAGKETAMGSWSTISSNFVDSLKMGVGIVGGPLLARVKDTMKAFNDSDKRGLAGIGEKIGAGLVKAFDMGEAAIRKWFPIIHTFAETMYNGFHRVFKQIEPLISGLVGKLANFMQDPAAFSKIEHLVGMLLAARAGGAILEGGAGMAGGFMKMAPGLAQMGLPLAELGPVALALAAALAVAAFGAAGFASALADSSSAMHGPAVHEAGLFTSNIAKIGVQIGVWWDLVKPVAELLGVALVWAVNQVLEMFLALITVSTAFGGALTSVVTWIGSKLGILGSKLGDDVVDDSLSEARRHEMDRNLKPIKALDAFAVPEKEAVKPPQHTTHIHKVEIKVNSNQDPSRIARAVKGVLMEEARNPRSAAINPSAAFNTRAF